jgi:hypothetical protein
MEVLFRALTTGKLCLFGEKIFADQIKIDVILGEFRQKMNTLSLWKNNFEEMDKVALAFALGRSELDDLDMVFITKTDFESLFSFDFTAKGNTTYEKMKKTHCNIIDITFSQYKQFVSYVIDEINQEHCKSYTQYELECIAAFQIEKKDLSLNSIPKPWKKTVIEEIKKINPNFFERQETSEEQ